MIRRFFTAPPTSGRGATLIRRTLLACAVGFFAAAAALGMVPKDEPHAPVQHLITRPLPLKPGDIQVGDAGSVPYVSETRIRRGDTLAAVLQRLHAYDPKLLAFLTQDGGARSIYRLYPGRTVRAATDDQGDLAWLRYVHTPDAKDEDQDQARAGMARVLVVEADGQGGYTAQERTESTTTQTNLAAGVIRSSLFAATDEAGIPDAITLQIADILGSRIDFLHGLRQGDRLRVVFETRAHEGRYAGAGRVLAVEFVNNGKSYDAAWFNPDGSSGAYYDFDGASLRGAFLRTALKFTRISSTFGMRLHPLHKTWTGHTGVDYAAPAGTPIHATADGVVDYAGWQNGYGNVVILKHDGKYSTVYAHQSHIADGLGKGDTVSQGQVIGYVGATGWATGPHLHYEFRVDNQPVDPLSVDLPVAHALAPDERATFMKTLAPYREQIRMLARMPGQRTLEDARLASL